MYSYPAGTVASRGGKFLAGCGSFKAVIDAAAPHDPILAASTSIISLQNIVSRETDPFDSQVPTYLLLTYSSHYYITIPISYYYKQTNWIHFHCFSLPHLSLSL